MYWLKQNQLQIWQWIGWEGTEESMRRKPNEAEEEKRYIRKEGVHERKGARKVTEQQRGWTSEQSSTRSNIVPSTTNCCSRNMLLAVISLFASTHTHRPLEKICKILWLKEGKEHYSVWCWTYIPSHILIVYLFESVCLSVPLFSFLTSAVSNQYTFILQLRICQPIICDSQKYRDLSAAGLGEEDLSAYLSNNNYWNKCIFPLPLSTCLHIHQPPTIWF